MPKTELPILNYVEHLLKSAYEDPNKVLNNGLGPWLVKIVAGLGVENIGTKERAKIMRVIEWVKIAGAEGNIPKMDLDQAFTYAEESLAKRAKKEEERKKAAEAPPEQVSKPIPGEETGDIVRVGTINDGTGRFWVRVMNAAWMSKRCEAGKQNSIACQSDSFADNNYINYMLMAPPKGNPAGPRSVLVGFAVNKKTKGIAETKQEGNQMLGHQASSGGWTDADIQFIKFMASDEIKSEADKFTDYNGRIVPDTNKQSLYNGGIGVLTDVMDRKPELMLFLKKHRPDMILNHKAYIEKNPKYGPKWFMADLKIEDAIKNPIEFVNNLDMYATLFGNDKVNAELQKIDLVAIAKSIRETVLKKFDFFVQHIKPEIFEQMLEPLKINQYVETSPVGQLQEFLKKVANAPGFGNMYKKLLDDNFQMLVMRFGGGGVGLKKLLDWLRSPKLPKHADADFNEKTGEYIGERREGDETKQFIVPDALKMLPQKERRDMLLKNQDYIKSFYQGDETAKRMEFLRFLFGETHPQDVKRTLEKEKEEFINYYDGKNAANPEKFKFPGIIQFYIVLYKNTPNYLKTNVRQSSGTTMKRRRFYGSDDDEATESIKTYYPMEKDDLKKYAAKIMRFYYDKSKKGDPEINRRYEAAEDYLTMMKFAKYNTQEIVDFASTNFSPEKIVKSAATMATYEMFFDRINMALDEEATQMAIEKFKDKLEFDKYQGMNAYQYFKAKYVVEKAVEFKYDVTVGEFIKYSPRNEEMVRNAEGELERKYALTKDSMYNVVEVQDGEGIQNGMIKVFDNEKQPLWIATSKFGLKPQRLEEVRRIIRKKLLESIDKKKISYHGVILDTKSQKLLLSKINVPKGWEVISHHMTIDMGELTDKSMLGKEVVMKVVTIAHDNLAIAVGISRKMGGDISASKVPHVTVAVNRTEGGKPANSVFLKNWKPIKSFLIKGIIQEIEA